MKTGTCYMSHYNWQKIPDKRSSSWMMLRMNMLQSLTRDMRVDLRSRNIRMPQQQLHHAEIRTVVQQMRGERMPKRVR